MIKLRKFKALKNEKGKDDLGYSGIAFEVDQLVEGKIYTQADQRLYDERGRNSEPFFVDDNGCSRDIKNCLKNGIIEEIFETQRENFFVDGKFYRNIGEFIEDELYDVEIEDLEDDWSVKCDGSTHLPIIQYNVEMIVDMAEDFSEEQCDWEYETILKAVEECVDFEKLNSMIPMLYYGSVERFELTKKDLLDYFERPKEH